MPLKEILAAVFCFYTFTLPVGIPAKAQAPQSHWYYCNADEIRNSKNTYYSTTFSSPTDSVTLLRNFSSYVSQQYEVPPNGLTGFCYGARPYKSDTFSSVEEQRSEHMTQSNRHRQNVIPTGWAGE